MRSWEFRGLVFFSRKERKEHKEPPLHLLHFYTAKSLWPTSFSSRRHFAFSSVNGVHKMARAKFRFTQ